MKSVYILIWLFYFLALYNICLTIFKIPKYESEISSIFKIFKKKSSNSSGDNYSHTTHEIAKRIKLPIFIKNTLEEKLRTADINSTPELYISNLINKSGSYLLFAMLFMPIHNIMSMIFIGLAVHTAVKGYKSIDDIIKVKTEKIEREIPKFLDFMTNSFKFNKNVKQSLESYEKIAGDYFRNNIQITIADMTTGNYENALKRLDARINSYNFSKVIRAIIQVVKGDENEQYLRNLYRESASQEYERVKREANKKLDKVAGYSKIMLICIITIIFTMIGLMLYKNFRKIGGMY